MKENKFTPIEQTDSTIQESNETEIVVELIDLDPFSDKDEK